MGFDFTARRDEEATFRLSFRAMAVIVEVLRDRGVLVDVERPALPVPASDEPAGQAARRPIRDAIAAMRSLHGVPAFKFESNEGWVVEPAECRRIAATLRACRVDEALTAWVNDREREHRAAIARALVAEGGEPVPAGEPWSTTQLKELLGSLVTWNETAARLGGYTVT